MEARLFRCARLLVCLATVGASLWIAPQAHSQILRSRIGAIRAHQAHTKNFIVFASSPEWAQQVAQAAESYRRDLAMHWLGEELPQWAERCPIHVSAGPNLNASGETKFSPTQFGVGNWMMTVNGTPERVLDSVLPHEISHTIFATHFASYAHQNRFVPRWADEGACTTVEHESEKRKHRHYLRQFLQTGRGLAFNQMFALKEYPSDILPLYAQGHSAVQFLIDQSGPQEFVKFLEQGMQTLNWEQALQDHFDYQTIGEFQILWNKWLFDGSPSELIAYAPKLQASTEGPNASLASTPFRDRQLEGKVKFAITNTDPAPVKLAGATTSNKNYSGNDSWYKRRYEEVNRTASKGTADSGLVRNTPQNVNIASGAFNQVSTPKSVAIAPDHSQIATRQPRSESSQPPSSNQPTMPVRGYSTARQQPPQSTQFQVLDWGNSMPLNSPGSFGPQPGLRATGNLPTGFGPRTYAPPTRAMTPISSLPPGRVGPVQMVPIVR